MEECWLAKPSELPHSMGHIAPPQQRPLLCSDRSDSGVTMSSTQHHDLQDQTALVTGATSGIARATALPLARDGAEVVVHGRDAARGAETVEAITAAGGRARFVAADLGDPADLQHLVEAVGDVDVLVNN